MVTWFIIVTDRYLIILVISYLFFFFPSDLHYNNYIFVLSMYNTIRFSFSFQELFCVILYYFVLFFFQFFNIPTRVPNLIYFIVENLYWWKSVVRNERIQRFNQKRCFGSFESWCAVPARNRTSRPKRGSEKEFRRIHFVLWKVLETWFCHGGLGENRKIT